MKTFGIIFCLLLSVSFLGCSPGKYLTPQQYGAKADGITDCTTPIREMLSDMRKGKIIKAKFPAGEYLISDGITIDFPCRIVGHKATIVTVDTLKGKYAFKYTLSSKGDFRPNTENTELSLNFKVHGVPVAFHGYNDIYMHDCTISTFTGTDTYYKNTKFWFAVDCDRMYDATFKRIHFDQPVNYKENQFNSADGLHITGLCHDILIEECDGHTGDDFIALNANEDTPGDIYNVTIRNCNIGSDTISKNGIRIYGGHKTKQLSISNVLIENCTIRSDNSPCIYITNAANGVANDANQKLVVRDLTVKDCKFYAPRYELASNDYPSIIRLAGINGNNLLFKNISASANNIVGSYFMNILNSNQLSNVSLLQCRMKGANALKMCNSKITNINNNVVGINIIDCKLNNELIYD